MRLNLPQPVLEEVYKKEKVVEERVHNIEACIVRNMKTRKRMDFTELLAEVLASLTMFKPQPHSVKKSIERLIEQEYIVRDKDDRNILHYKA